MSDYQGDLVLETTVMSPKDRPDFEPFFSTYFSSSEPLTARTVVALARTMEQIRYLSEVAAFVD